MRNHPENWRYVTTWALLRCFAGEITGAQVDAIYEAINSWRRLQAYDAMVEMQSPLAQMIRAALEE